ncbi:MAG TPA: peptide ligase PGM1-related protein [Luteitalea sp.]|nr:peptide ligase PGM1-related protein [Luteitalea sp.]
MIPQPPFAATLSTEEELQRFEELKPRLKAVWDVLMRREDQPGTSVVVPSLTLDQDELRKLDGATFYEERLLFLLIRLRNPRAHVVYVTSQPVHPLILDYYLHLLAGVPASHARARLTMLCTYDASPRALTQKVLERPRLIERIREAIPDPSRAYLTVFNSTPLERKLAVLLGIPLNGLDPKLNYLGTKSGSRKVFREADVELPEGFEDLTGEADVEDALVELAHRRPGLRRAVVKLNDSFSGEGNAIFRFPEQVDDRFAIRKALRALEFAVPWETHQNYFQKFSRMGGIVEEFIDAAIKVSPSAQLRTSPAGEVLPTSTHDQILGGPSGQIYQGCSFPARDDYRMAIQERSIRVGQVLARADVVSRFGVDFLAYKDTPDEPWKVTALEINLRVLGTTHPFLALQFLTGGTLDTGSGMFISLSGRPKYYMATDNLRASTYRGVLPEDLIDIVTDNGLHYSHRTESGVLFHLIGALSEYGKLGLTVIASSPEEVQELYSRTLDVLARETGIGHS